jgi:hypothetical protein
MGDMSRKLFCAVGMALGLAAAPAAPAQVVTYTSLGSNQSYDSTLQTFAAPYSHYAVSFVPTASGLLSTISLPLVTVTGANNSVALNLLPNNSVNNLPVNAPLESWNVTNLTLYSQNDHGSLKTASSVSHPALVAGTTYWVDAVAPSGANDGWFINLAGNRGNNVFSNDGGTTWIHGSPSNGLSGGLEVTTLSPVPEPGSMALVAGAGLAALGWRWRRRRAAAVTPPTNEKRTAPQQ